MLHSNEEMSVSPSVTIDSARHAAATEAPPVWVPDLRALLGRDRVCADFETRLKHSRDRLPFGRFRHRSKLLAAALPSAVVEPASIEEVQRLVRFAVERKLCVIPYGSGSGVLGGTVAFDGELIVAARRMNRIIDIDETNRVVRLEAGTNGGVLEAALREAGYTCGHYPQSIDMSTVGGWAACRGTGQSSSRYGGIEDMIVGMKVVLPSGEVLEVRHAPRRAVGPSLLELFIGSEGTFGIIVELTMRIWRLPDCEIERVVAFPSIDDGLNAVREVMQAELRPSIVRLYDEDESERWGAAGLPAETTPVICMFAFSGCRSVAEAEAAEALAICGKRGAVVLDNAPFRRWKKTRFTSHSDAFVDGGGFYDTIEVAAPWSEVSGMYARIRGAVTERYPLVQLTAHWSHVYSDGACMYMTVKFPAMADEEAFPLHAGIWDIAMRLCLDMGGTISHHHGIGYFRNKWIGEELNAGHRVLRDLKRSLDPGFLFNPGKLGLAGDV
jgi:alkyldihydroxyacetonephosphate synthase